MADEQVDTEAITKSIMDGLKGLFSSGDDDPDLDEPRGRGANARIRELSRENRMLKKRLTEEVPQQIQQLSDAYAAKFETHKTETADTVKNLGLAHVEDLALVDLGVTDPLGRKTVREAWANEPKDGRGKSPSEWWGGIDAAHKAHIADPKANEAPTVPRALTPYLPQQPAKDGKPPQQFKQPRSPEPGGNDNGLDDIPMDKGMDAWIQGLARRGQDQG